MASTENIRQYQSLGVVSLTGRTRVFSNKVLAFVVGATALFGCKPTDERVSSGGAGSACDSCGWTQTCVNSGGIDRCAERCSVNAECSSNCCAPLLDPSGVTVDHACASSSYCGGSGTTDEFPDAGSSPIADAGTSFVCGGRYQVLDVGSVSAHGGAQPCPGRGCDGSGLVKDTTTGLTWSRFVYYKLPGLTQAEAASYCAGKGMRLPTKDEALAIAGNNFCGLAWPGETWSTWTSTSAGNGQAWCVNYNGNTGLSAGGSNNGPALCVR